MLGLSMTEAGTQSLAQAGCLEKGHGQYRVLVLGWAPQASPGVTEGSQAGGRGWAVRWGLCSTVPSSACLAAHASITRRGYDERCYSALRDALEQKNLILNRSAAFWKTSSLYAQLLTDDEFAISLGNWTW